MTSEIETLKTNEFLRRRKLRLQQVREQSKDIAKKVRQRATVEKIRRIVDIDAQKEKEYLHRQETLVNKLQELYSKGVTSIGTAHKHAEEVKYQDKVEKTDVSKLRGKEAAAELRKRKQEKLDEQKRILDRKLQARVTANEISREKSNVTKLLSKPGSSTDKKIDLPNAITCENENEKAETVTKNDMATQWDLEGLRSEWIPNVPELLLPKEDSVKESINDELIKDTKSAKTKRPNLFAVSDDMPSSLRGGLTDFPEDNIPVKPSLTLVSEYLQNRVLHLRESETGSSRNRSEDLQSLKQTILKSRTSKTRVSANDSNAVQSTKSSLPESALFKKSSVTMYNHATKDSRNVRCDDAGLVLRDQQSDENAYSQALKETATNNDKDKEYQQKIQDMRNKVAMTKKSVEKEYKDTMAFLNSLPRDSKPVKNAYKDERSQKAHREIQQRRLQQEFNKIEKECRKHSCGNKHTETTRRSQSKSPAKASLCNDLGDRDFEYSWMPVPESDGNLIVHTIPTTLKEGKSGNTVKFSEIDSYHEYRSRHKHTPPTRDRGNFENQKVVETVLSEQNANDTTVSSSIASDTSSVENLVTRASNKRKVSNDLSDAEKIIIYKILDSKSKKRRAKKMINNTAKSLNSIVNEKSVEKVDTDKTSLAGTEKVLSHDENTRNLRPVEELNEGIYKTVSERGDNITTMYFSGNKHGGEKITLTEDEIRHGRPCCCGKSLSKNDQREKCSNVSWEIEGNKSTERTSKSCVGCKCGCASNRAETRSPSSNLASAATSTSSFKTAKATDGKTNTAQPEEGLIKLTDDGVQEAGKFYIGASGFLKDDDYEVVIQLRKRDANKDVEKDIIEEKSSVSQISKSGDGALQPGKIIADELKEKNDCSQQVSKAHVSPKASDNEGSDIFIKNQVDRDHQDIETQIIHNNKDDNLCDKGTSSSLPDTDSIKTQFPKTDQITKAVTSAYTQTTASPSNGQVFIHMSSSTSTAYMSPPELILPKFLKHGYHYDQLYEEPKQTANYQNERYNVKEQKEYYEENKECMCRRCIAKNVVLSRLSTSMTSGRRSKKSRNLETPPSTAKSYTSPYSQRYTKKCASGTAQSSPLPKKHQCRCRKSAHKFNSKECIKSHRSRRTVCSSKRPSKNVDGVNSKSSSYKNKLNFRYNKKLSTTSLDPIIKDYVNKLLFLNREGLKTIEIVNKECSAVTTPGSSIINVPYNLNSNKPVIDHKISLEQVKLMLMQQISEEYLKHKSTKAKGSETLSTETNTELNYKTLPRMPRWKQVHKIKSLNISKRMLKKRDKDKSQPRLHTLMSSRPISSSSSTREIVKRSSAPLNKMDVKSSERKEIKSSVTPKPSQHDIIRQKDILMEKIDSDIRSKSNVINKCPAAVDSKAGTSKVTKVSRTHSHKIIDVLTDRSSGSDTNCNLLVDDKNPVHTSTQTNGSLDSEINFMKLAEDKLQNMEKIADLTEKCTKRLSSLAKVLEGVRKNKSLAYSQISASESTSDSEPKSDKNIPAVKAPTFALNHMIENDKSLESKALLSTNNETPKNEKILQPMEFVPFLTDIPKPVVSTSPLSLTSTDERSLSIEHINIKTRPKPPPALTRVNLKIGQDCIVPHELSTVLEVDSPMSLKSKTKSSQNGNKTVISDDSNKFSNSTEDLKSDAGKVTSVEVKKQIPNLDLLQSDIHLLRQNEKSLSADSSDDSKLRMIDLKQFNDIMLKPYITLQEYAIQRNVGALDEGSNLEEIPKDGVINDDISSLRSDGSLPDVIAELLKRNIINEPFKFDTASNVNSTTVSSDSTFPMLALSKARRDKKKQSVVFQNKENVVETSDSLSISSNPDLENAFKKLGLGWASSTLKKTKERLALSSSSNTSSSSLSQLKLKSFDKPNIPNLVSESVSSVKNVSVTPLQGKNTSNNSKNVEQQTLLTNSMTVKEFLTNELAKKITFTNKSNRSDTTDEFVSLYETKMPEEMKHTPGVGRGDRSADSVNNNRARTSTPVQIYKAAAYHSSSSSNLSNGLFSNIEDLSSVKGTSNSLRNYSTTDKDDLTIPNYSLKTKKGISDCSKSD